MAGYQQILDDFEFEEQVGNSLVVREPIGVVGAITPWNYPLHQIIAKVAPALAAGCTVVLKPSEVTPLDAFILAEIIDSAGLPAGVFNLVTGTGPVVGEAIASHPDVDMVSFTGSTRAGKRVTELGAQTVKRVHLELGGKSANVFLDDANLEAAVPPSVTFGCYLNSGQTCSALTRMVVPRDQQDEVVALAKATAESITLGPADSDAQLGPLVSATQRDRVRGYIQKGIDEGATLVTGGVDAPEGLDTGYFVQPTIFADVTSDMTIAQEEIFGPVLVIMPYDDEDDALAHRQQHGLRAVGRRAVGRRRPGQGLRPQDAHRPGEHQRGRLQHPGAVRRLPPVGQRPRARQVRARRVPRDQVHAAPGLTSARSRSCGRSRPSGRLRRVGRRGAGCHDGRCGWSRGGGTTRPGSARSGATSRRRQAARLRPEDAAIGADLDDGTRLSRCLRCDLWMRTPPPEGDAVTYEVVPPLAELDLPRRGKPLEDAILLRVIAIDRGIHGVLFALVAVGLLVVKLDLPRIQAWAQSLLSDLNGTLDNTTSAGHVRLSRELERLLDVRGGELTVLLVTATIYAVVESTEAYGLWRERPLWRRWAEYLTVVATAGFLPFEIRELMARVSVLRVGALVVNLVILVYLVYAKRLFGLRGGAAALEAADRLGRGAGQPALARAHADPPA